MSMLYPVASFIVFRHFKINAKNATRQLYTSMGYT